jgi:hypothetical protein
VGCRGLPLRTGTGNAILVMRLANLGNMGTLTIGSESSQINGAAKLAGLSKLPPIHI